MINKQTKIVATVSDRCCDVEFLQELYESGVNVVRLNTAHQTHDDTLKVINNVRKVSNKIAILVDTKGPEVRTAGIEETIELEEGDVVYLTTEALEDKSVTSFQVNYDNFVSEISVGNKILIDDGEVGLDVIEVEAGKLTCKARNKGVIKNRKSVNVPDVHIDLPSLTQKDRDYIEFSIENDVDFIAHSFVRNKEDVMAVQEILDAKNSPIKIIAKIENREGVNNIEEILDYAHGVMVARGDLGIEIPMEEVPMIQKSLIKACIRKAKPVITATQMLHTMIENPLPTRAEVSDVANAVLDGADAVMLSGETAYGKYPLEAVKTMSKIIKDVENNRPSSKEDPKIAPINLNRYFLIKSAIHTSNEINPAALVVHTISGYSARLISAYRSLKPTYAFCSDETVIRHLALNYGITPMCLTETETRDELVNKALKRLIKEDEIKNTDTVILVGSTPGKCDEGTNFIEVGEVSKCLTERK